MVEADAGAMGDSDAKTHEFQVIADSGEDEVVVCKESHYAANIEKATTHRGQLSFETNKGPIEECKTPNIKTIEQVANFFKKPRH